MRFYRTGPEGFFVAEREPGDFFELYSDPFTEPPSAWKYGRRLSEPQSLLVPLAPSKIVGIGRNYREHAEELGNEMPPEPLIFLKAVSSLGGPETPIVLPPESADVQFEGEIGLVVGQRLCRADAEEARAGILGITCANDVTARDLQRSDKTFARGKSFDSFCPVGPCVALTGTATGVDLDEIEVITRVDGEERQRGQSRDMAWGLVDLVRYVSQHMTLVPGDLILTGTPAGVGSLAADQRVEVEISGVGILSNPVEVWRKR